MQNVKRIFAFTFSLFIVTLMGAVNSICFDRDYLSSLIIPNYLPPSYIISALIGLTYILFTIIITTSLLCSRKNRQLFYILFSIIVLNVFYMIVFFRLRYEITSLFILFIQIVLMYILLKHTSINFISVFPILLLIIIYTYLLILNYGIVVLNG